MIDQSLMAVQDVGTAVEVAIHSQYTDLASLTILIFDWLLTLPSEVSLIWGCKWSFMTLLYFLARYLPFVYVTANMRYIFNHDLTATECRMLYNAVSSMFWVGILFSQLILTIRTWAIWERSKGIAYSLFGLFGLFWIVILTLTSFHLKGTLHGPGETYSNACDANTEKSTICLAASLTLLATYETVVLALMLFRGWSSYWPLGSSHLLKTIYRDGLSFYVYLFAIGITNLIIVFHLPEYMTITLMLEGTLYSVLSCRVILHIRQEFGESYDVYSGTQETTLGY